MMTDYLLPTRVCFFYLFSNSPTKASLTDCCWKFLFGKMSNQEVFISSTNSNSTAAATATAIGSDEEDCYIIKIYPLRNYYFGSKQQPLPPPNHNHKDDETLAERVERLKANYASYGMRACVEAVLVVELFKHPHLLLLQVRNSFFKLPGGRLRPGESDIDGLKRKLSNKLSSSEGGNDNDWEVGECLGKWWRPDFETLMYPYLAPSVRRPKECIKLFLIKLPRSRKFILPKNLKMLAVPLCEIHENSKGYGPLISGIPQLLSKFSFSVIED